MIDNEEVRLIDDTTDVVGFVCGFEYRGYVFVFESTTNRTEWLESTTPDDVDFIISESIDEV